MNCVNGDIFDAGLTKPFTMLHVVNNARKWGSGFTEPLTKKFPQYKTDYFSHQKLTLGEYVITSVGKSSQVIGLIAQHNVYHREENPRPLDYEFLYQSLEKVKPFIQNKDNVIMPHGIGSGLARGNKNIIEVILKEVLSNCNLTAYKL